MVKKYNKAVFIGRMQPFHNGHKVNIEKALEIAEKVIVILGSSKRSRSPKNPFSDAERVLMISGAFSEAPNPVQLSRIEFKLIPDSLYSDNAWISSVQAAVAQMQGEKVALVGHNKDGEGSHLKMFPNWDFVDSELVVRHEGKVFYASDFRKELFESKAFPESWRSELPESTVRVVEDLMSTKAFSALKEDYFYYKSYPERWGRGPHITTDAVVVGAGHVLMVRRGMNPGKGCLALPGGFLDPEETFEDGMLRELKEETKIKVPPRVLRSSIKEWAFFDHPKRSLRGRIITHAAYIQLDCETGLPRVKGGDDAAEALWVPISELEKMMPEIYEDHYSIIKRFVG